MANKKINTARSPSSTYEQSDVEKNKTIAGLAYLIFFLPLLACPDSKYGRFHANQSLLLFIASIGGFIILGIIPSPGWLLLLYGFTISAVALNRIIKGFGGKVKEIPLIGRFRLLK